MVVNPVLGAAQSIGRRFRPGLGRTPRHSHVLVCEAVHLPQVPTANHRPRRRAAAHSGLASLVAKRVG
jgi:hypothetical protein